MENSAIYILIIFFGVLSILIIPMIIEYFKDCFDDINYVKMELNRSESWREIAYWRRELTAARLSIIPGISDYRAKAIMDFFGFGKRKNKEDGIFSMLMPSFLGIGVCAICLMGSTFAWFTASQSTGVAVIKSANFIVSTEVKDAATKELTNPINGIYTLSKGEYSVTIASTGTAGKGYCEIILGEDENATLIPTNEITKENPLSITLEINADNTKLQINSKWGEGAAKDMPKAFSYPENTPESSPSTPDKPDETEAPEKPTQPETQPEQAETQTEEQETAAEQGETTDLEETQPETAENENPA